jgi:hypothetical protein
MVNPAMAHLLVGYLLAVLRGHRIAIDSKSVYAFNVDMNVFRRTLYSDSKFPRKAALFTALQVSVAIFGDPDPFDTAALAIRPSLSASSLCLQPAPFFASLDLQDHHDTFQKPCR